MIRPHREQLRHRFVPTIVRLVWQSSDQIETNIVEAGFAKRLGCAEHIVAAVHPARSFQFIVLKRLHAHADTIESGFAPCGTLLMSDRFRIGLESDLFEFAFESGTHGFEYPRKPCRIKQAWRSSAEINRIDDGIRNFRNSRLLQQAGIFSDFAANRFYVRSVEVARKHTGVKIAVGALGLAKGDLHVHSESHGQVKTL